MADSSHAIRPNRTRNRAAGTAAYARLRQPILTWGATAKEAAAHLPGGELLEDADGVSTRAIGIDAPASAVWPWLAQLGPAPRGGAYTYDWIENLLGLNMHSVDRVLPEFQHPEVGEVIEFGSNTMRVERVEPEQALSWRSQDGNWVWTFVLDERAGRTRLISRNRFRLPTIAARIGMLPMEPGSLVMERRMLLGIKSRAERLAAVELDRDPGAGEYSGPAAVDLYWLPLGAGGHFVRFNGRVFEALSARCERRVTADIYHSALEVQVPEGRFVIEQAPVADRHGRGRGVVAEGAVGAAWAGRFRIFRYEIRRWRDGRIPDLAEAAAGPQRLTEEAECARRLLDLVPQVPTPVWGRDELSAGEMWNSNAIIAWLVARSGLDAGAIRPPDGGRAPGWEAGVRVAQRQMHNAGPSPGKG